MTDENGFNPPAFVKWSALSALLFLALGVVSGPVLRIEWLAITSVAGCAISFFIVLGWIWGECVSAIR